MRRTDISRRSFLKRFGAGALAASTVVQRARAASAAVAGQAPLDRIRKLLAGARWKHAVGDPRGIDIAVLLGRSQEGRFGVMFKRLAPFAPPDELLAQLAATMVDPQPPLDDVSLSNPAEDNHDIPAGFVYLGQFIDHDLTFDTTPLSQQRVDPQAITNFEGAHFDLTSIYGRGPTVNPELYDPARPGAMLLATHDGVLDLPRQPDGTAYIGDPRNDENLIVCQLQIAFLRLHNAFLDQTGSFEAAQQQTRRHFQWIMVHEFLPRVVGQDVVDTLLSQAPDGRILVRNKFYMPKNPLRPMMPIEFSAGAYRFGHSMIRAEYEVGHPGGGPEGLTVPLFSSQGPDLRGSRPLPADFALDWNYFFDIPNTDAPDDRNFSRLIDTKLSLPLANLPPTVVTPGPGAITALAARNLLRGKSLGLPAGQDVATAMGVKPLSNAELGLHDPRWGGKAPLWFYILKEAELGGGHKLGPVGGRIVAEVILGVIALTPGNYFSAQPAFSPATPDFRMGDLLVMAGAIVPGQHNVKPPDVPGAVDAPGAADAAAAGDVAGAADPGAATGTADAGGGGGGGGATTP